MRGKVAKMLRKMRRSSKEDKRIWHTLTPAERGAVSWAHRTNERLMHIDYLPDMRQR